MAVGGFLSVSMVVVGAPPPRRGRPLPPHHGHVHAGTRVAHPPPPPPPDQRHPPMKSRTEKMPWTRAVTLRPDRLMVYRGPPLSPAQNEAWSLTDTQKSKVVL